MALATKAARKSAPATGGVKKVGGVQHQSKVSNWFEKYEVLMREVVADPANITEDTRKQLYVLVTQFCLMKKDIVFVPKLLTQAIMNLVYSLRDLPRGYNFPVENAACCDEWKSLIDSYHKLEESKFNDTHNTTNIYQLFVHMMLVREQVKQGTEVWKSEKWKFFLKDIVLAQEDVYKDDEDGYISYKECSSDSGEDEASSDSEDDDVDRAAGGPCRRVEVMHNGCRHNPY